MGDSKFSNFDNMSLQSMDDEAELIPLLTAEDEEEMNGETLPETYCFQAL
jgi:ATP-dependent Lon protease